MDLIRDIQISKRLDIPNTAQSKYCSVKTRNYKNPPYISTLKGKWATRYGIQVKRCDSQVPKHHCPYLIQLPDQARMDKGRRP